MFPKGSANEKNEPNPPPEGGVIFSSCLRSSVAQGSLKGKVKTQKLGKEITDGSDQYPLMRHLSMPWGFIDQIC